MLQGKTIPMLQLAPNRVKTDPMLQDHHGRDPYRVALRNNNASVAGLLENYMKRLSGYHGDSVVGGGVEGEETDHSPLYASPTAYGYSKIGEHRLRQGTHSTNQSRMAEHQILAGFDRCAERTNEFTFGHTGHMDIILGR